MHHPIATVEVNGRQVSGAFWSRLIRLTVTDRAGLEADSVSIDLLDGDPFLEIPKEGAKIRVWLGYKESGERYMGAFTVESVSVDCIPYAMTITGKSADVRETLKEQKERHWDERTVKDIVSEIAQDHGLQPIVSAAVADLKYDWIGQLDESDLHFLTRLGQRTGAMVTYKDGKLIFAERASGLSASGGDMTPIIIDRSDLIVGTCKVRFSDRGRHKRVVAKWQDKGQQKRKEVEFDYDSSLAPDHGLRETYANEDEAKRASKSRGREQQAESDTIEFSMIGNPDLKGGAPFRMRNVRPGVDGLEWTVDPATHTYSKSGYTTRVSGKRRVESGGGTKK